MSESIQRILGAAAVLAVALLILLLCTGCSSVLGNPYPPLKYHTRTPIYSSGACGSPFLPAYTLTPKR